MRKIFFKTIALAAMLCLSSVGCDSRPVASHERSVGTVHTLTDMLVAGKYDWVNDDIIQKNFPVNPVRFTTAGCKVFHFDKVMNTAEIEAAIRKEGYEPASLEQLLAYGTENPEEQREYLIIGLGFAWVSPHGNHYVPCLCGDDRRRNVGLIWDVPRNEWRGDYRFLASRK